MPPWDTWIAYYTDGCLLSWVPPDFVASVGEAVRCNAYEALYWLKGSKSPFAEWLEADGLLF
ncbi:MAG TPA: hypothetical protein VF407_10990 [Polyangiaceae bacterium]